MLVNFKFLFLFFNFIIIIIIIIIMSSCGREHSSNLPVLPHTPRTRPPLTAAKVTNMFSIFLMIKQTIMFSSVSNEMAYLLKY